jgi:hypothetical protein
MKKICLIFLMLPIVANAAMDLDMRDQMLDSEIEKLTHQRDEKFAALQKCEQSTHGFKIAGLTTLVATGVGVYGNIKLAQKLNGKNGGSGIDNELNLKKLTPDESKNQMCDEDCPSGYSGEQCEQYSECWKTQTNCECQ